MFGWVWIYGAEPRITTILLVLFYWKEICVTYNFLSSLFLASKKTRLRELPILGTSSSSYILNEVPGTNIQLDVPETHNTMLLVRKGEVEIVDGKGKKTLVNSEQVVLFEMKSGSNAIQIACIQNITQFSIIAVGSTFWWTKCKHGSICDEYARRIETGAGGLQKWKVLNGVKYTEVARYA